jgi:NAD+ synthase (glutamine-hydrolysing)
MSTSTPTPAPALPPVYSETRKNELSALLNAKLKEMRVKRAFNPKKWIEQKCTMLNDYMCKAGLKACTVSVSGGIDSAVMYGLCVIASKQPGSPIQRVVGVAQPIHSTASIWERALELPAAFGGEVITVDQTAIHTQLDGLVSSALGVTSKPFASGQLRSYMRTPVGYYVAQLLSQEGTPAIVMGTGNQDEDGYLMYYCKAGDGVVDVQLIADLHKSEVFVVAREIGVPASILAAPPSADLWEGQTDEDELGMSYDFVELYVGCMMLSPLEKANFMAELDKESAALFMELGKKANDIHRRNSHKAGGPKNLNIMPVLNL